MKQKRVSTGKVPSLSLRVKLLVAALLFLFPAPGLPSTQLDETAYIETKARLATIQGMDQAILTEVEPQLRGLSYKELRALRAFCGLAEMKGEGIRPIVARLSKAAIGYDTVLLLEYFTALPKATLYLSWGLLDQLRDCDFVATRALSSLFRLTPPDAAALLPLITAVKNLEEPGQWAAKALFEVRALAFPDVAQAIDLLGTLHPRQQWAVEQVCRLDGWHGPKLLRAIKGIRTLTPADARNGRALFAEPSMTPDSALSWITEFLPLSGREKEGRFDLLTAPEKISLLAAYRRSSEEFIMEINNLHDITDTFGGEIGDGRLLNSSSAILENLFTALHPTAQNTWSEEMARALSTNRKTEAIAILRKATALARRATAEDLSTANLYILVAEGSELYTSSFRDIVIPALDKRIRAFYRGDILAFLTAADPAHGAVSPFITNLAEKGALARFLPRDPAGQKKMIDLVAVSAFHDQYSLLLFSSALPKLFQQLAAEARTHLIDLMFAAIGKDDTILSRQLQVILQYSMAKYGTLLLSPGDRAKIAGMGKTTIDVSRFTRTPFREWRRDKALTSLAVFQPDSDGHSSFLANCLDLLGHGYSPSLSTTFSLGALDAESQREVQGIIHSLGRGSEDGLTQLFRLSTKSPIIIDWRKGLNNIEITHAVTVYQGKSQQRELITQFLKSGCEMFAQRGHSYWRYHQLSGPLLEILSAGAVSARELGGKQRFLSLGSCGGIKAYLELNRIFHDRVDILATVGTGRLTVNNLYNRTLFELVATRPDILSWEEVASATAPIFTANAGEEYLQPGSLPAILYKMAYQTDKPHDAD